jgi:hypothetical protein
MTLIGGMVVEWVKKKGKKGTQFWAQVPTEWFKQLEGESSANTTLEGSLPIEGGRVHKGVHAKFVQLLHNIWPFFGQFSGMDEIESIDHFSGLLSFLQFCHLHLVFGVTALFCSVGWKFKVFFFHVKTSLVGSLGWTAVGMYKRYYERTFFRLFWITSKMLRVLF